jgi:hypothetical protein
MTRPDPQRVGRPGWRVVAELVRLPAVLSVPGDTLLGAAAAGVRLSPAAAAGRAAASGCLYLGGMALNDYADREVDAAERPHRPIPSGRASPAFALRLAQGLTVAGLALAAITGGRRALPVAGALAGSVWAYDLALKDTPAGPAAMAACRALDVALGAAGGRMRGALVPAAAVAGHTLTITLVSRHEAQGGTPAVARRALAGAAAVTALGSLPFSMDLTTRTVAKSIENRLAWWVGPALLAAYAGAMARAGLRAERDPSPARLQQVVGTGVLGFMPLEGALLCGLRRTATGAAVAALWPVARHLARRRSVT